MTIKYNGFHISAVYKGDRQAPWNTYGGPANYNRHVVTIYNPKTRNRFSFSFWASIANPHVRTRSDILGAVNCAIMDANAGALSFDDFCAELGYDYEGPRAATVWAKCKRHEKGMARVGFPLDEIDEDA